MNNNDKIYKIAKTQVDFVKSVLGKRFSFEDNNTNETNGGYTTYGTLETPTALIIVRVSNHICSMDNWIQRYKPKRIANKKLARRMGNNLQTPYKDRCFFSVVFKAFDYQPNDVGSWRAICNEYTFDPLEIEENGSLGNIAQDCLKLNSNKSVSINGQAPTQRIAQKGNTIENNQQTNENKTMNKKQTIRLNENQLRRIVTESVKRVLKEDYLDKSWNSVITDDGFWRHTPEQIHTYLLKRGYCVGMPKEEVMQLIEWARSMFFLPLDLPKRDKDDVINIVMCKLKGDKFYNTFGGDRNEMDV